MQMSIGDRAETGASAVEYGLLISLIALVVFAGISAFGTQVDDLHRSNCDDIATAVHAPAC